MISSFRKSSTVAKGWIKKWIQLLIATCLIDIETGTDKNAIGIVKHHKVGAARAENGPDVYKKDRESRKNVLDMFTRTCLIHRPYRT